VTFSSIIIKLAAAELAQNSVVRRLFQCLLHFQSLDIPIGSFFWHSANSLAQLHTLQLPLRYLPLLLNRLRFSLFLLPLLRVGILFKAFTCSVSSFALFCDVEGFALFNEYFAAHLAVLHNSLLIELSAAVIALNKTANLAIFIRLFCVLKPGACVSGGIVCSALVSRGLIEFLLFLFLRLSGFVRNLF
jgi:hypothetical protein